MRLSVIGLTVRFGAVSALNRVDLDIAAGERRAVIGPNGAGKTTLLNVIAGELQPTEGSVHLAGRDATSLPPWRRARLGLGRTFQRSTLFDQLTVAENVTLAARARLSGGWRFWPARERAVNAEVASRLEAGGIAHLARRRAASLGHGERRILEIEVALAAAPTALLIDEPMAGLSGAERHKTLERLQALPEEVTVVIVEHDLDAVFALAKRISVLDHGIKIADGTAAEVRANPLVQEVYLGAI
jgi:branched-chain amino acid transport system ATP-binding protein